MSRRQALALVVYAALIGTVFTDLYEPLAQGRDDSWAVAVVVACAHLGLGIGVARAWVLLLPVGAGAALALTADELGLLVLVFVLPALMILTALGWGLGRLASQRAPLAAGVAFAIALWPVAWAASDQLHRARARHVPAAIQARLPTDGSLSNLCPGAEAPPALRRDARRRAEVLVRELDRHPDDLVTYTYILSDEPDPRREDITVRELAQEELEGLKANGPRCELALQRRLRAGIG